MPSRTRTNVLGRGAMSVLDELSVDRVRDPALEAPDRLEGLLVFQGLRCAETPDPLLRRWRLRLIAEIVAIGAVAAAGVGVTGVSVAAVLCRNGTIGITPHVVG